MLTPKERRLIAGRAGFDPRTVARFLSGLGPRSVVTRKAILQAMKRLGFEVPKC